MFSYAMQPRRLTDAVPQVLGRRYFRLLRNSHHQHGKEGVHPDVVGLTKNLIPEKACEVLRERP